MLMSRKVSVLAQALKRAPVAAYSSGPDSDYLYRGKVPTNHFQKSLPRLPIPKLEDTCQRYLKSQRPLCTGEEFQHTEKLVEHFQNGDGKVLHEELLTIDKANKHTSYISAPWSDMYLKDRRAVALNHNPFMSFKDDERPEYNNQLVRSTNFVMSSLRFMKTLRAGVLEPEVFHLNPKKSDTDGFRKFVRLLPQSISWYGAYLYKAFPLDMSQFPQLFNTNRIPRPVKDELVTDPNGKHLLVLRKGHLYKLDVLDQSGNIKSASEIMAALQYILDEARPVAEFPLGVMTSQDRDTWTAVREKVVAAGNAEQLEAIDSALFALSLDTETPEEPSEISRLFLHSDGKNRFFDKCLSLVIAGNGKACVTFEHSWGDGVAVLRYFNEVYKDSIENPRVSPSTAPANVDVESLVKRLDFNFTDDVKASIKTAAQNFKDTTSSMDLSFILYDKMGKNFLKEKKFSPDGFMQLGLQLAFYRQYGQTVATYESCSTSAFRHGRTETIRPATTVTKAACEMFERSGVRPSVSELKAAMDECSKMHGQLTKEAAMGQGFDRHLFVMRYMAMQKGQDLPEIYNDPAYARINHIILSTSTLSSPALLIGGFGAVVKDGYGCGYSIQDEQLGYIVTAYPPHRDVHGFLDCVRSSVADMKSVLEGHDFK